MGRVHIGVPVEAQRMTRIFDLDPPARQLIALLNGVTDDQLSARTPYSVGICSTISRV